MGWQEAKKRYDLGETAASQKVEDLVARRVIRGMGGVERQLPQFERSYGLYNPDSALWPRTFAVLQAAHPWPGFFGAPGSAALWEPQVIEVDAHHKAIMEYAESFSSLTKPPYPVFFTRVKDTQISLVYYLVRHDLTGAHSTHVTSRWLIPPVQFIASIEPWWLAVQETEHFIRQFGTYQLLREQE